MRACEFEDRRAANEVYNLEIVEPSGHAPPSLQRLDMNFQDHFSSVASDYARNRPNYPDALFAELAARCPSRRCAWDCATGNGQAALALAEHFERVIATDASAAQIAQAIPHPRIEYRVAVAEASGLPDRSVELVTVAQALHWFDFDAFYREARRVLVRGGILACWTYSELSIDSIFDAALARLLEREVGAYWPKERRYVDDLYRSIPFPFEEPPFPEFVIEEPMTLERLAGYLGSWSSTQRYRRERGRDPIPAFVAEVAPQWEAALAPDGTRRARWRMGIRIGINS